MAKIYTKAGDYGETGLVNGQRVAKSCKAIGALGDLDELNAYLGAARLRVKKTDSVEIAHIQGDLFIIGSAVAGYKEDNMAAASLKDKTKRLEDLIDAMDKRLPRLNSFILPSGCESAVSLHLARAVCRRCERSLLSPKKYAKLIPYLNRLSDYLFTLARYENYRRGIDEERN